MHPTRRLAWWVAWNIDGLTLFPSDSISRSGERLKLDPRIPADAQAGERAYDDNDLDRGHVARRSDLLWGATLAEARQASSDSFFFTNITPQRSGFNQSGRGGVWGLFENAVLALEGLEERRVSLFAGALLAGEDPVYRDVVQLPREHWKVVAYRIGGQVRHKAFLLTQSLDGIEGDRSRGLPRGLRHLRGVARPPGGTHRPGSPRACAMEPTRQSCRWWLRGWSPTRSRSRGDHGFATARPRRAHCPPWTGRSWWRLWPS